MNDFSQCFESIKHSTILIPLHNNEIEIKKNEIDHMNEQITEMKRGIAKQTIERNNIRSELEALRRQQLAKHKIAEARRSELEGEIRKLEKQNQVLTTSIDKTQERANEALLVIIQLEFEIKTYENLLDTQNNFDMSRGRHASNGSRSSGSSRGSGRASPLYATRKMDQQEECLNYEVILNRSRIIFCIRIKICLYKNQVIPEPVTSTAVPQVSTATSSQLLESTPRNSLIVQPSNNMRHTLAVDLSQVAEEDDLINF